MRWNPVTKRSFIFLPNLITLFNLFSGFLSLLMAARGKIVVAGWMIILSLVWDSLDGNIARMFKNPSDLGRELDSLADIVSFVVAPAFLMAHFLLEHISPWMLLLLFLYLSAGTYRLARFNLRPPVKDYFEGLPTPAAAVLLAMTHLCSVKNGWTEHIFYDGAVSLLLAGLSFLMVSHVRFPKLSAIPFVRWQSLLYLGLACLALVSFFKNFETGMASVLFMFVLISPFYSQPLGYKVAAARTE